MQKIILGSASRGRQEMLTRMGIEFTTMSANIDEQAIRYSDPKQLTAALARAKAATLLPQIREPVLLITADGVVAWQQQILEKPESAEEARQWLTHYSQAPAENITAVMVTNTATGAQAAGVETAWVWFRPIPEEIVEHMIKQGNLFNWAGGFDIADPALAPYIEKIEGPRDSVMGLPIDLTRRLMQQVV